MLKRFLRHPRTLAIAVRLVALYVRFCLATTRWTIVGEAELAGFVAGDPLILAFWHEMLPLMPVMWRIGRGRGMTRGVCVLASLHQDGQLIGEVMRTLGMGVVSGSSSRGGAAAFRQMLAVLRRGDAMAITPDGPRGPRRVAAAGVAHLAALAGVPVLAVAAASSRDRALGTWDRMRLPLPFGRGVFALSPRVHVARGQGDAAAAAIAAALNAAAEAAIGGVSARAGRGGAR